MKKPRAAVRKGASICYPARVLLGNWCCQSNRRRIRVRWWNELLGQGIFQFPHTVIAHIAPGIQGCSFVICPALPQNAPAIRFPIGACLGCCCGLASPLALALAAVADSEPAADHRAVWLFFKWESPKFSTNFLKTEIIQILDNFYPSIGKGELNPKQTSLLVNMYTI